MMKRQTLLIFALILGAVSARAQSSSTTIKYNDKMQPAHVLELPNTTAEVQGTILKKLKDIGYSPETQGELFWKKNTIDGFYVFNNVVLPSLGTQKLDMYFKILQKNKEEANNSTVYMLVSSGNENFATPEKDSTLWNDSQTFLNSFVEKTVAFSLEKSITDQQTSLNTSQKKLLSLQKDERDLSDKIKKYQDELLNNKNQQREQQLNIDTQVKSLADLIIKRK